MQQQQLFYEDEYDALKACVQALGGAKKVGSWLWPDKPPGKAAEHLNNSMNPNHLQKLSFSEGVFIMRKAREIGCHVAMHYIAKQCNYAPPTPVEREDQISEIQRAFNENVKMQTALIAELQRLTGEKQQ